MDPIRIAIVGCGAVTERGHLPALAATEGVRVTLLVDKNLPRAEALAKKYDVPQVDGDHSRVWDSVDAAIVALPHYLHAPVSTDLLGHGTHVLVEKPMALSTDECEVMIQAAHRGKAVLAIGLMRRFLRSSQFTRAILEEGLLGPIESFDVREGWVYDWPVASDFFFRKETAGGGVLIDTGAHSLDTVLWWFGDVASFEYFDDSYGGVEADCRLNLVMASGATGIVELSRTRRLRNTAVIKGEWATLETHLYTNQVSIRPRRGELELAGNVSSDSQGIQGGHALRDLQSAQLADWVNAIRNGRPPAVPGEEGRRSIALIEACYEHRKPLDLPWMAPDVGAAADRARGR